MSHRNSKGERGELVGRLYVQIAGRFTYFLEWPSLEGQSSEADQVVADRVEWSGQTWETRLGNAVWTRPPMQAVDSHHTPPFSCCLQGGGCSHFLQLPSMPPSGSASPLRSDHVFGKATAENKKPTSAFWTQKSLRAWLPGRPLVRAGRALHSVQMRDVVLQQEPPSSLWGKG